MNKFPNDWSIKPFGEFISSVKNGFGRRPEGLEDGPIVLRLADVTSGYVDLKSVRRVYMPPEEFESYRVEKEDLLFVRVNGSRDYVAQCIYVDNTYPDVAFNDHLMRVRLNLGLLPQFASYLFKYDYIRSKLLAYIPMASGGQLTINQTSLSSVEIPIPPLDEQHKIAEILSTWDEAITLTEALIEALQRRKQALMQRLLTGEVRFPGFDMEWEEVELGKFLIPEIRKVEKPNSAYLGLGIRSHGKGTFTKEIEDPEENVMTHLFEVKKDDLIVNITFAWEGAIALVNESDEGKLVSHRFPTYVFDRSKVLPQFFKYLMLTKDFFNELGLISPGSAGRNRVMSKGLFLKIEVDIPDIFEQEKIGDLLQTCDDEISALIQYSAALQAEKKGLMQQLLTGQVRV